MIKIYIDTNIISGFVRPQFSSEEMNDFDKILDFNHNGTIKFFTSKKTGEEIDKIKDVPGRDHHLHNLFYKFTSATREFITAYSLGTFNSATYNSVPYGGGGREDPLYISIKSVIPKPQNEEKIERWQSDIVHLFQFKKNDLDIFLTRDGRTILSYAERLDELGIIVKSVSQCLSYINDNN